MSGTNRKLTREAAKKQYERFCEAWRNEKRFQQEKLSMGQSLPEGSLPLGKRPTFSMWLTAVKNKAAQAPPPAPTETKQAEVVDPEW
jgi:hypothetical protein